MSSSRVLILALFVGHSSLGLIFGACTPKEDSVTVGSFNVKWIGFYDNERDDDGLADLLKGCDLVVIQELVAPPDFSKIGMPVNWPVSRGMHYPNGEDLKFDDGSTQFFQSMRAAGFDGFVLSDEDTGPVDKNHRNDASTEWFVAFYKSEVLISPWEPDGDDLPKGGFIANDLTANANYQRVPFAFWFRTKAGMDFVLISVHLQPNAGRAARARRKEELGAIARYVERESQGQGSEKDWFVLGDMNIQSCDELEDVLPARFVSLNDECRDTVPSTANKPYDHVLYRPDLTQHVDTRYDMVVEDLVEAVRHRWTVIGDGPYPGDPYKSRIFPRYFSDHNPISFRITDGVDDD